MPLETMSPAERLDAVFALRPPDRTPVLGGWIACPDHLAALAEVDLEGYWADPTEMSLRAYRRLSNDGLIGIFVPRHRDDYRCVDHDTYSAADRGQSVAQALADIEAMPSPEQLEAAFDFEAAYAPFRQGLVDMQTQCGDLVWMPAQWGAGARISWDGQFGYENFFHLLGAHLNHAKKLMEVGGAQGRSHSRLVARAVEEGLYPRAVLLGEDICTQRGPMVSPDFMENYYFPQLTYGLEPLLRVGCKPLWHCDGDVRPLFDMLIEAGVQGFQGFQPECGLTIDTRARLRTREGDPVVIFGPLAVTTELPVLSPAEVRARVHHAIRVCRETGAGLCLFTGNTLCPDVPLANIGAMCEAVREA